MAVISAILSLLAFIVDILTFVPHFAYGTWLTLAAFICSVIAMFLICTGRRTLIGRKVMRRRIEDNSEMSAHNYLKEQADMDNKLRFYDPSVPQYADFEVENSGTKANGGSNNSSNVNNADGRTNRGGNGTAAATTAAATAAAAVAVTAAATAGTAGGGRNFAYPSARTQANGIPYPMVPLRQQDTQLSGQGNPPYPLDEQPTLPTDRSTSDNPYKDARGKNNRLKQPQQDDRQNMPQQEQKQQFEYNDSQGNQQSAEMESIYSNEEYVSPRSRWAQAGLVVSPSKANNNDKNNNNNNNNNNNYNNNYGEVSRELPNQSTTRMDQFTGDGVYSQNPRAPPPLMQSTYAGGYIAAAEQGSRSEAGSYYEDVEPRFEEHEHMKPSNFYDGDTSSSPYRTRAQQPPMMRRKGSGGSYPEDDRQISSVNSISSHFTSVSQRGVNPRWQPPAIPNSQYHDNSYYQINMHQQQRRPPQRSQSDKNLEQIAAFDDFSLPNVRPGKKRLPNKKFPPMTGEYGAYPG